MFVCGVFFSLLLSYLPITQIARKTQLLVLLAEVDFQSPLAGEGLVAIVAGESPSAMDAFPVNIEGANGGERLRTRVASNFFALVCGGDVTFQVFRLEGLPTKRAHLLFQRSTCGEKRCVAVRFKEKKANKEAKYISIIAGQETQDVPFRKSPWCLMKTC